MRAPVFKPLFFQVKPLPCGAAQKASNAGPAQPEPRLGRNNSDLQKYVRDHLSPLNLSGTCRFALRSEVRKVEYFSKPCTLGPPRAAVLESLAHERKNRPAATVLLQSLQGGGSPIDGLKVDGCSTPDPAPLTPAFSPKVRPGRHVHGVPRAAPPFAFSALEAPPGPP